MNSLGLNLIFKNGCFCSRETVNVNGARYSVLERLGEGGFSSIDLVENQSSKKRYALKRITCHSAEDQRKAEREMQYCKMFKHTNIIPIIDSAIKGCADIVLNATSEALLVLPYYKRGTLHDGLELRSQSGAHLAQGAVLQCFLAVCEAVKYLHDYTPEPIAHRDIKAGNVCLQDDMSPVLMDLGSAGPAKVQVCGSADAQRLQDFAAENCSMPYRAPELFNVESYCVVDQRTDIWSLGCLLYAMCYFKSPFEAAHERGDSVALAVISGNVRFPDADSAPYTAHLHDLIRFMLRPNPMERPFIYSVIEKAKDCPT